MAGAGIWAERILPWELVRLQCTNILQRTLEDQTDPSTMRFFKGKRYTLTIKRRVVKVTAFIESNDQTQASFQFLTGGGTSMTYYSTARKFLCMEDILEPIDPTTGECVQQQTWTFEGEWKEITADEFLG